jgi:hypothetical protein
VLKTQPSEKQKREKREKNTKPNKEEQMSRADKKKRVLNDERSSFRSQTQLEERKKIQKKTKQNTHTSSMAKRAEETPVSSLRSVKMRHLSSST